jgi:prepilin-type N-terminal cleavage/methylation domain-containing protein
MPRRNATDGLTLVELLVSIAVLSIIVVVFSQVVAAALDAWSYNRGKGEMLQSAQWAMERMVGRIRATTWVLGPLRIYDPGNPDCATPSPRDVLVVSRALDNDGDGLSDEDPGSDITADSQSGVAGINDDNDGLIDEGSQNDNDEDGATNEDGFDGIDNDSPPDCRIDEDPRDDFFGGAWDDDGDGDNWEDPFDPVIFDLKAGVLRERYHEGAVIGKKVVLCENVSTFQVVRRRVNGNTLIDIYLKLDDGKDSVELNTTVLAFQRFDPK